MYVTERLLVWPHCRPWTLASTERSPMARAASSPAPIRPGARPPLGDPLTRRGVPRFPGSRPPARDPASETTTRERPRPPPSPGTACGLVGARPGRRDRAWPLRRQPRARRLRRRAGRESAWRRHPHDHRAGDRGAGEPGAPRRAGRRPAHRRRRRPAHGDARRPAARRGGGPRHRAAAPGRVRRWHGLPAPERRRTRLVRGATHRGRLRPRGCRCWAGATSPPTPAPSAWAHGRCCRSSASASSAAPTTTGRPLSGDALERRLYVVRRVVENAVVAADLEQAEQFYVSTLSCNRIVLQGAADRLAALPLLRRPARRARDQSLRIGALALQHQHHGGLAAGAPLPAHLPQRRDQHPARQHQRHDRPPERDGVGRVRRGSGRTLPHLRARPERHRDLRQRPGAAPAHRPVAGPVPDDDDPRGLRAARVDVAGAARLLRLPRLADGALGRPRDGRRHRRQAAGRRAGPQRPAAAALHRDQGRRRRHGLGDGRARHPARSASPSAGACSRGASS